MDGFVLYFYRWIKNKKGLNEKNKDLYK